jgi:hypothetical protein
MITPLVAVIETMSVRSRAFGGPSVAQAAYGSSQDVDLLMSVVEGEGGMHRGLEAEVTERQDRILQ